MKKITSWLSGVPAALAGVLVSGRWLFLTVANAQSGPPPIVITTKEQLTALICNILIYFFWIVIVISVIMVLLAAFDYVTAGDDTEKTTRGRKRLTYAAVGVLVALLASGFPAIISSLFPSNPNTTLGSACTVFGGGGGTSSSAGTSPYGSSD
jgi:hypothetical protein